MNKKIAAIVLMCMALVFCVAGNAFAVTDTFYLNMTNADGSTTTQTTFGWNETPWLHIHLPTNAYKLIATWWESPSPSTAFCYIMSKPTNKKDVWLSLDDGIDLSGNGITWGSAKENGYWIVRCTTLSREGNCSNGTTGFTVTPEPVSAALFLIGGVSMAAVIRKRRNARVI